MNGTAILTALGLASLLTLSHGILKWVAEKGTGSFQDLLVAHWMPVGVAIAIYVFIFVFYLHVLRTIDIGVLYPLYTGLSVLLVFAVGAALFSEPVSAARIGGCVLIAGGVALVSH